MAKIIIEVSDEYIRQQASSEALGAKMGKEGENPMSVLYDLVAFVSIEKQLDKGVTEFRVSRDELTDEIEKRVFDRNLAVVLIVAGLADKKKEKTNEN